MKYKKILLKLSGEMLSGKQPFGIENDTLNFFTNEIKKVVDQGVKTGIVIGGGNIFRGSQLIESGFVDRAQGDYMGMLATVINGIALQTSFARAGIKSRHITSFPIEKVGEMYHQEKVLSYFEDNNVLIFTGGTSNPYFTTDSAAALRAIELNVDILLKGTKVDGVYNADPNKDPNAVKYEKVSFTEVLSKELKVMDMTDFALCRENNMPIIVFDAMKENNLIRVVEKSDIGTLVHQ